MKENWEDEDLAIDTDDIKKIVKVDLRVKVKGASKTKSDTLSDIYLTKEKGGWKLLLSGSYY